MLSLFVGTAMSTVAQRMLRLDEGRALLRYRLPDSRLEAAGHAGHDVLDPARRHGFTPKSTNRCCLWLGPLAVGRYPSLRQRANQRRWRFVGGDPRFGVAQVLLGGFAGIGAARTGLWVLAVAFAIYLVSIFWGEMLWKRSLTA